MNRFRLFLAFLSILIGPWGFAVTKDNSRIIKTYLQFGLPIDPASVQTLVDLDISYALGTTLTDWTPSRELKSGLAESWEFIGDKAVAFTLSAKAKWSDGTQVTSDDVIKSLNRSKKDHSEALESLFSILDGIEAKDSKTIVFTLKVASTQNTLVRKLTEPMYGVFWTKDGKLSFEKSSGPFRLKSASESELQFDVNKNWIFHEAKMADGILIKKAGKGNEVREALLKDTWANLFTASSLMPGTISEKFMQAHYKIWNRNLDRVFFFAPSPKLHNQNGRQLIQFLNENLNRDGLVKDLSGYSKTNQFFPQGYVLFDPEFKPQKPNASLPEIFKKRPLVVLGAESRLDDVLKKNISTTIKAATGMEPQFKLVSLSEFEKTRAGGDYDFLAGALPVNDPNIEGAIGFYFGLTPAIIANGGTEKTDYKKQIEDAKKLTEQSERSLVYRKVFASATEQGCVLPLFHYATVVIAKSGLDLSKIPTTDKTISFSKVRLE